MLKRAIREFGRLGWVRPTILLLMICQIGRFYSDAPVALAICFDHNHGGMVMLSDEAHHEHQIASGSANDHDDLGFKVEHCRDTYQGMNLIPSAVLSLPAAVVTQVPAGFVRQAVSAEPLRFQDTAQVIFHPPQLLS